MVKNLNFKKRSSISNGAGKILIPIAIIVAGLLIAGAVLFVNQGKVEEQVPEVLSPQQAAEKAINFINQNMLPEGATALLINVIEEIGFYKIHFKIGERDYESYVSRDGKFLFPEGYDLEEAPAKTEPEAQQEEKTLTIGNFFTSKDEICREDGKPIIYFFGSEGCSHCKWEHPIMEKVAEKFEGYISFHNNMNSQADMDIFSKYSTGGIPTLVFGCRYYRVGSGERVGEENESNNLTALICKLTENQPANTCNSVEDLINQIKD